MGKTKRRKSDRQRIADLERRVAKLEGAVRACATWRKWASFFLAGDPPREA